MKGGNVEFGFTGNTKDIESKAKNLSNKLKGLVSIGGGALMGMASASAKVLVDITGKAIKSQAELEQQIGGTEAVFGQYAKTVQKQASEAYNKMGLSANDYMQNINKMASLMKGSGLDTKKSMDLSSQAMQRAADVASIMGISTSDAMKAITGAAKGNFTMMDNLGVAMNATSLQAYALSKGIKTAYKDMEQGEKVELAMQMFMEKSAYAAGNYAKENKTLTGSLNTLKGAFQNLLSGTGTVEQLLAEIGNFGNILIDKLITLLPKVAKGIIDLIKGVIPLVAQKLPVLLKQLAPVFISGITDLVVMLIQVLPQLIQLIADIIPDLIPPLIDAIMIIIPEILKNYPLFVKTGLKVIGALIKGIIFGIASLLSNIGKLCAKVIDKLKEKFEGKSIWEIGEELVKGLWNGIKNVKQWIIDKIKGFGSSIVDGIKDIFGISSPSKEFEIIGRFNVLGLEKGMEKESMRLQSDFNEMFSLSPSLYGTSNTHLSPQVNVINNINMKQDALGQMVNDIKTFSGGAKNDYSYGMGA